MLESQIICQNRYQLIQQLGENQGRQTWLASDLSHQNQVVVKLLAFSPQMEWEQLKLFEREAAVLQRLNHPRIPKYRDYFFLEKEEGDGLCWFGLVQDFIPGISLQQLITQGKKFTESQIKDIATQVLEILIYLHKLAPPIWHRDIKPSNLLLGEDNQIYLLDFGAVQNQGAAEGVTFTVVGTTGYAPLEQFWGKTVPASDLYALGATIIHLLTGISPADLPQEKLRIKFADRVSVNRAFVKWVEGMTEPDPHQRYQTALSALEDLKAGHFLKDDFRIISSPFSEKVKLAKSHQELKIVLPINGQYRDFVLSPIPDKYPVKWGILPLRVIVGILGIVGLLGLLFSGLMVSLSVSGFMLLLGGYGLWVLAHSSKWDILLMLVIVGLLGLLFWGPMVLSPFVGFILLLIPIFGYGLWGLARSSKVVRVSLILVVELLILVVGWQLLKIPLGLLMLSIAILGYGLWHQSKISWIMVLFVLFASAGYIFWMFIAYEEDRYTLGLEAWNMANDLQSRVIFGSVLCGLWEFGKVVLNLERISSTPSSFDGEDDIHFDRQQFVIKKQRGGKCVHRAQGKTPEIDDCQLSDSAISILAGGKKYVFADGIGGRERKWIVTEIREWLQESKN